MPLLRFRLPSGRLVTITYRFSFNGGTPQASLISVCGGNVVGGSNRSKLPLIPVKAGVLDNIFDTLSVTDVDTSLSKVRMRMSSSCFIRYHQRLHPLGEVVSTVLLCYAILHKKL